MLKLETLQNLLNDRSNDILSLYLHVDPGYQANQNETSAWRIYLKNAVRDVKQSAEENTAKQIEKHLDNFFEDYSPQSKSLVLFVNEGGILEQFDLPVAIENFHNYGDIDVVKLLWSVDEYERYLVVLVDNEQARFMSTYLGSTTTSEEMRLDFEEYDFGNKRFVNMNHSGGAEGLQGSGGGNFEDMKDEHIRRFHKNVAEQIYDVMQDMDAKRIILAGSEQAAHQVKDLLHESVKNQVVSIAHIPVKSSESEVAHAIQDDALNYERSQELDLVNEVIGYAKSGGRGVLGSEEVQTLLEQQQVELLILPYPMEDEELARNLTIQALKNGIHVELVHGSATARLNDDGEVAARLYYAVPQA